MLGLMYAGKYQTGYNVTPLHPNKVKSIVQYRLFGSESTLQANGYSLVYSRLQHLEGLQNFTSGIIHHVYLTGMLNLLFYLVCLQFGVVDGV